MIKFQHFAFNPYQVNSFVLYDETGEGIIIDAANHFQKENESLESFLRKNKITPVKLLTTHYHFDHILGNRFVKETWNVQIEAHASVDLSHPFYNITTQGKAFGLNVELPPPVDHFLNHHDTVRFGKSELQVIHIPGHSNCSIVFYCKELNTVFSGDVLFNSSIGRTDLYGGNHELLIEGITENLLVLPDNTIVWPGHGPETSIGFEKRNNPYL